MERESKVDSKKNSEVQAAHAVNVGTERPTFGKHQGPAQGRGGHPSGWFTLCDSQQQGVP